ncbi:hypothetical protein JCM8097_004110 [Rhodosporidiobolus ruineniae]
MPHALVDDLLSSPEPSFGDKLFALEKAVGRHPAYNELDGDSGSDTDVQDSDRDDFYWLSIAAAKQAKADRAKELQRIKAKQKAVVEALASTEERSSKRRRIVAKPPLQPSQPAVQPKHVDSRPSSQSEPPTTTQPMEFDETSVLSSITSGCRAPNPQPAAAIADSTRSSRRAQPESTVPSHALVAELVDAASSPPKRSTSTRRKRSPPPRVEPYLDVAAPSPVIELSLDEEDVPQKLKVAAKPRSSVVRAGTSAALLAAQNSRLSNASTPTKLTKTGRKKSISSLEVECQRLQKLTGAKLVDEFKTISDLVEHLKPFQLSVTPQNQRYLAGSRICFVNTDHWRRNSLAVLPVSSTSPSAAARNRLDQGVRTHMTIAAKYGATLVKPEDFVPPPYDIGNEPFDLDQADREGWTTHLIPFVPEHQRTPTFDEVLACLGPEAGGIRRDELGPFVKVVRAEWLSKSVGEARGKALEWPYELKGDWRAEQRERDEKLEEKQREVAEKKRKEEKERRKEREKERARGRRPGAARDAAEEQETQTDGGSDDEAIDAVSPFDGQDYPQDERPPKDPDYFGCGGESSSLATDPLVKQSRRASSPSLPTNRDALRSDRTRSASASASSDPIVDADQTRLPPTSSPTTSPKNSPSKFNDLEEQLALIRKHGIEAFDAHIEEEEKADRAERRSSLDEEFIILSKQHDDFETDEENEAEELRRQGKKVEKERFNPYASTRRQNKGSKYACDDPTNGNRKGPNEYIAKQLDLLASIQDKSDPKTQWRERGYRMAAGRLRNYPKEIKRHDQLTKLRGIGDKMATKILEIQQTGTLRRFSYVTPAQAAAKVFSGAYGIGAALAEQLYQAGARTIDDLRNDPDKYGLLETAKIGLQYYEDLQERIPRDEVTQLFEYAKAEARKIDPRIEIHCMGSYRRGQPDSGDIDLLVSLNPKHGRTHEGYVKKLWNRLLETGFAQHTLTSPGEDWNALDAKVNGLCHLLEKGSKMRRIDILGVPYDELPAALIYFTGNDYFNRSLRLKARHLGYRLNQRGLYKNVARDSAGQKITAGKLVPNMRCEEDIFRKLGVKWRPPHERMP